MAGITTTLRPRGLRRGLRALLVPAAALAAGAAALLALPTHAHAGTYVVAQCDKAHAAFADARFDRTSGAYYSFTRDCSGGAGSGGLRIADSSAAPVGAQGRIKWWAPSGASIVGVRAEAALRSDAGHRARLAFINAGGAQTGRIATGPDAPGGFRRYAGHLDGTGKAGFAALLICANDRPCPRSEQARTAVRNVRLTVRDGSRPTVAPSGTLLAGGWLRGSTRLAVAASDRGSGLHAIEIDANGKRLSLSRVLGCRGGCGERGRDRDVAVSAPRARRRRRGHRCRAVPRRRQLGSGLCPRLRPEPEQRLRAAPGAGRQHAARRCLPASGRLGPGADRGGRFRCELRRGAGRDLLPPGRGRDVAAAGDEAGAWRHRRPDRQRVAAAGPLRVPDRRR